MLRESRQHLQDLNDDELLSLAETLCHGAIEAFPIYECVKVFARLDESGSLTYARHRDDIGSVRVTCEDVASRMKDESRSSVVLNALSAFEKVSVPEWPFAPGSSSWLQLEILHPTLRCKGPANEPTVVVRRACRLRSSVTTAEVVSSPLVDRIFESFRFKCPASAGEYKISFAPSFRLKNIAGSGLITESAALLQSDTSTAVVAERVSRRLIEENVHELASISPGFFVKVSGVEYRVASVEYTGRAIKEEKSLSAPLPFAGLMG